MSMTDPADKMFAALRNAETAMRRKSNVNAAYDLKIMREQLSFTAAAALWEQMERITK